MANVTLEVTAEIVEVKRRRGEGWSVLVEVRLGGRPSRTHSINLEAGGYTLGKTVLHPISAALRNSTMTTLVGLVQADIDAMVAGGLLPY